MDIEFCRRLRDQQKLIGTMVTVDAISVMEVVVQAGVDWVFIEAEHAPIGAGALERLLPAAGATPCLVRIPDHSPTWIKQALDLGAAGIIVPQVNTAAEAAAIASVARYAPDGQRGIGVCRANRYGYNLGDYLTEANEGTAVIVQAEHIDCVANARAIAETKGIDGVFVGPFDLSASMGVPGQLDDPRVNAAISEIREACVGAGKPAGCFGVDAGQIKMRLSEGFTLVACSIDMSLLHTAVATLVKTLNED